MRDGIPLACELPTGYGDTFDHFFNSAFAQVVVLPVGFSRGHERIEPRPPNGGRRVGTIVQDCDVDPFIDSGEVGLHLRHASCVSQPDRRWLLPPA